jgi:hypothetical protein
MEAQFEKNSQGYYRVKLPSGHYLRDVDLMMACTSSFVSSVMTFSSKASAVEGYSKYLKRFENTGIFKTEISIIDDFKLEE